MFFQPFRDQAAVTVFAWFFPAVNRNFWAMTAIPVIFLAPQIKLNIPRIRYAFYIYYPAHLAVILAGTLLLKV
jgi:hypothetical protein